MHYYREYVKNLLQTQFDWHVENLCFINKFQVLVVRPNKLLKIHKVEITYMLFDFSQAILQTEKSAITYS